MITVLLDLIFSKLDFHLKRWIIFCSRSDSYLFIWEK